MADSSAEGDGSSAARRGGARQPVIDGKAKARRRDGGNGDRFAKAVKPVQVVEQVRSGLCEVAPR